MTILRNDNFKLNNNYSKLQIIECQFVGNDYWRFYPNRIKVMSVMVKFWEIYRLLNILVREFIR